MNFSGLSHILTICVSEFCFNITLITQVVTFPRDIPTETVYFAPTPNPFNILNQQQNSVV